MGLFDFIKNYRRLNSGDPYFSSEHLGQRRYFWEQWFEERTISGFKFRYKLSLVVDRMSNAQFEAARLLEPDRQRTFVAHFNKVIVAPRLKNWAAAYVWHGIRSKCVPFPSLKFFHLDDGSSEAQPSMKSDIPGLVVQFSFDLIVCRSPDKWSHQGCVVRTVTSEMDFDSDPLVAENFAMLTARDLQDAGVDSNYLYKMEHSVIAALKGVRSVEEMRKEELERLAKHLRRDSDEKPHPLKEQWRQTQASLEAQRGIKQRLIAMRAEEVKGVQASAEFLALNSLQQREWLDDIERRYEQAEEQLLRG